MASHIVRDKCCIDAVAVKLPGSQASTLQKGACFVSKHIDVLAHLHCCANHAECRAESGSCQCPRIAVRQNGLVIWNQWSPMPADRLVDGDVFFTDLLRLL